MRQAWHPRLKRPDKPDKRFESLADRLGRRRVDRVTRFELQELVNEFDAGGVNPSTIEAQLLPLRLTYRRLLGRGEVQVDPTDGIELPEKTSRG